MNLFFVPSVILKRVQYDVKVVVYFVIKLRQSELVSDSYYFSVAIAAFIMSFLFSSVILKRVYYDVVFVVYFVIKLRQSELVSDSHY
ncbi:hypothetical protein BFP78_12030 [Gaetbulibacter sp. 5U11]|nr:hypothetical protein BFP78_12030 [Gaetbulibacter sp. 5U11]